MKSIPISLSKPIALLIAFVICCACSQASGQNNSTLSQFNKSKQTTKPKQKQKGPHRQLAKNFNLQDNNIPSTLNSNQAQKKSSVKKKDKKEKDRKANNKKTSPPVVTEKRRAELMAFVNQHHKELKPLLNQLKKTNPAQHQSAIRTLDRNVKNLQTLEGKSKERHARSLNNWILSSKVQLLTAKLARKNSEKARTGIRKQIRGLLEQQNKIRREQLSADLATTKKKAERLEKLLAELNDNTEGQIAKKLADVEKTSDRIKAQHKKRADKKKALVKEKKSPEKNKGAKQNNN